jgi:uncharacterized membrane protein YgdD (TMEM256/DUF423 family)
MRQWVITGAILAAVGVAIGAFGAHGLRATFAANGREGTFHTGNQYHMYHALALFIVAWLRTQTAERWIQWAGYAFVAGILLFSGSLYALAITDVGIFGAIAPLGGTAFIVGWLVLAYGAYQTK